MKRTKEKKEDLYSATSERKRERQKVCSNGEWAEYVLFTMVGGKGFEGGVGKEGEHVGEIGRR